jgi:hypothetical protein
VPSETFDDVVARVARDGEPSSGDNLLGMQMDFDAYLSMLEAIDGGSISVERTDRPDRLLRVSCRAADKVSLAVAAQFVVDTWKSRLRYAYLEQHQLVEAEGVAVLDFVTQMGPGRLYVTGRVEIHASK